MSILRPNGYSPKCRDLAEIRPSNARPCLTHSWARCLSRDLEKQGRAPPRSLVRVRRAAICRRATPSFAGPNMARLSKSDWQRLRNLRLRQLWREVDSIFQSQPAALLHFCPPSFHGDGPGRELREVGDRWRTTPSLSDVRGPVGPGHERIGPAGRSEMCALATSMHVLTPAPARPRPGTSAQPDARPAASKASGGHRGETLFGDDRTASGIKGEVFRYIRAGPSRV